MRHVEFYFSSPTNCEMQSDALVVIYHTSPREHTVSQSIGMLDRQYGLTTPRDLRDTRHLLLGSHSGRVQATM